jgi:hypothetical protein
MRGLAELAEAGVEVGGPLFKLDQGAAIEAAVALDLPDVRPNSSRPLFFFKGWIECQHFRSFSVVRRDFGRGLSFGHGGLSFGQWKLSKASSE